MPPYSCRRGVSPIVGRPLEHRVDPRDQLVEIERLGHVVVAALREPDDFVLGGIPRGHEDDRRRYSRRPEPAAHFDAVEVGHHHVEQDECRVERRDPVERGPAVVTHVDHEAREAERAGEEMPHVLVVVDDEEPLTAIGTGT